MNLGEALRRLELRIAALESRDRRLAEGLRLDLEIVRRYTPVPATERAVGVALRIVEQLANNEHANAPATRIGGKRSRITAAQAAEAVRVHGSIREAARRLGVSHTTVRRKLEHVPRRGSHGSSAAT